MKILTEEEQMSKLTQIASSFLCIDTLKSRGSSKLDCHEVTVTTLRMALNAAYNLGFENCKK